VDERGNEGEKEERDVKLGEERSDEDEDDEDEMEEVEAGDEVGGGVVDFGSCGDKDTEGDPDVGANEEEAASSSASFSSCFAWRYLLRS
jgi:hypothetical protein